MDRVLNGRGQVELAAHTLHEWLKERPEGWSFSQAACELEEGLVDWELAQGWRAPCARFISGLRRAFEWATERTGEPGMAKRGPRDVLIDEVGLWLESMEEEPVDHARGDWDGQALADGARVPRVRDLIPAALHDLTREERILLHGESRTVLAALSEAQRAGLRPTAVLSECGADFAGKRMARQLADAGVRVELTYDARVLSEVEGVDRVWLGTEAVGAGEFLGRVGTRLLLREAARLEVPTAALVTGDKVMPGGQIKVPDWCAEETWILWPDAPRGVALQSGLHEHVPFDAVGVWLTEAGRVDATDLLLRHLWAEGAPPCRT